MRQLSTLTVLMMVFSTSAYAGDVLAKSAVSAATVYADRANVTRTAEVDLPAGASAVVLNGLPDIVMTDSLRVEAEGTSDIVLGAIENKLVSSAELAAPHERDLNDKLQALKDQQALLMADQQALGQKQQFLSTLSTQANMRAREDIATIDLKPNQWKDAAETLATTSSDTLHAMALKVVELRKLTDQINAINEELGQIQTGARSTLTVKIPVEARSAGKLSLKLSYQIPNASWAPIYDARLDTATGKVTLTQFGAVHQQTGEDWSGVKLTLSTAQPARGSALPPLDPMWVSLYENRTFEAMEDKATKGGEVRRNLAVQSLAAAPEASMVAAPAQYKAATFQAATLNAGGYVSEYNIPGAVDVLADGTAKKVMIGGLQVSSALVAKVKPQVESQAYLVAVTTLGGEAPLLPGSASLFRDGAFIGSTDLPMLRPSEEAELSFGVDDQIVVKQRIIADKTGETGVITKDTTRTRQTLTEVQNLHKIPVKVALLQTVPVPQNDKIKLTLDKDYTTAGYAENVDNISGQLRWNFTLAPQQKNEVKLGWSLSWPKDSNLSGLPF